MQLSERSTRSATRASRRRWRLASSTASSAVVLLVGCGGGETAPSPELPRGVGERLAEQAHQVGDALEAGDGCLAAERVRRLQASLATAIEGGQVERPLQQPLRSAVRDLVARIECVPPQQDEADEPAAPEPAAPEEEANACAELEAAKAELEAQQAELQGGEGKPEEEGEDKAEGEGQGQGGQGNAKREGDKKQLEEQLKDIEAELRACEQGSGEGDD